MGESLVEVGDEESGESNLPGWRLEAGWMLEWGRGRWKGRRVPWQLVLVLGLLEEPLAGGGPVGGWDGGAVGVGRG